MCQQCATQQKSDFYGKSLVWSSRLQWNAIQRLRLERINYPKSWSDSMWQWSRVPTENGDKCDIQDLLLVQAKHKYAQGQNTWNCCRYSIAIPLSTGKYYIYKKSIIFLGYAGYNLSGSVYYFRKTLVRIPTLHVPLWLVKCTITLFSFQFWTLTQRLTSK